MAIGRWLKGLFGKDDSPADAEAAQTAPPSATSGEEASGGKRRRGSDTDTEHYTTLVGLIETHPPEVFISAAPDEGTEDYADATTTPSDLFAKLKASDPAAAIRILRLLIDKHGDLGTLLEELASLYISRRDAAAAERTLRLLTAKPTFALQAHIRLANLHEREGKLDTAYLHAEEALALKPYDADLHTRCKKLQQTQLSTQPQSTSRRPRRPLAVSAIHPPPPYEIDHPLGQGGMGMVFKGRDTILQRPVALKFLKPGLRRRPEMVKRFFDEAQLLARLDPEGVVEVLDIDRERHVLDLEYISGGTLADRLDATQNLSKRASIQCMARLCATLKGVHAMGVVHADIKPQNILFRFAKTPVLADFGAAVDESEDAWGGTDRYSPSREFLGTHLHDGYALSLVFGQMISGQPPPSNRADRPDWMRRVLGAEFDPELTEELVTIVTAGSQGNAKPLAQSVPNFVRFTAPGAEFALTQVGRPE